MFADTRRFARITLVLAAALCLAPAVEARKIKPQPAVAS